MSQSTSITGCAEVLAICSCISYLFLALWFGLHAFVAAQAYKVRILTQLVRLPIPSHLAHVRTKIGVGHMIKNTLLRCIRY